ncbi:MAG TPA: TlpA disulfide reductase family protein [Candidatus Acidoferrales bacterium]|nr:TlpA disulfide reductase family protein [Candidatus Acidoferrales bacterium]
MRPRLRRSVVGFACLALGTLCAAAFPGIGVRAQPASEPQLKTVQPNDVKALIAANKGKVVFLNFFATYCVPCHKEFPDIVKLQAKYKAAGLEVVEISMNDASDPADRAEMAKYLDQTKPTFAVYLASSIDDDFYKGVDPKWAADGEALPMTTIFDRDGKVAHFYEKALSFEEMERDVTPLLKASASN